MGLSVETALRWSQTYSISALRALFWISMKSEERLRDDPSSQGWTDPLSKRNIMEQAGISRSQSLSVSEAIDREIERGARVGQKACYRLPVIVSHCETEKNEPSHIVRHAEGSVFDDETPTPQDGVSQLETQAQEKGSPNVSRNVRHQQPLVSQCETNLQDGDALAGDAAPIVSRDVRQAGGSVSEGETALDERVGVKESFTESDSPDQSDQDALRDNGDAPAVAADIQAWLQLSGNRITELIGKGVIPRERLLELAQAEIALKPYNGKARMSLVGKWTNRYYGAPDNEQRPMFAAICRAFGFDSADLTDDERGVINKTAAQLVKARRKPEDVAVIYAYCARQNWSGGFKPSALLSHASAALAGNGQRRDDPNSEANRNRYTSGRYADIIEH